MIEAQILKLARTAAERAVGVRRDFHRHPELAYTEFRTASLIARRLTELGLPVRMGQEVMKAESRMGLPSPEELVAAYERAAAEGADPEFLPRTRGGFTGVVTEIKGGHPGPTVALRVDIDALPIKESAVKEHVPTAEGFVSCHPGLMHSCGHDGHASIGLAVAEVLATLKDELHGTYRLIFQPGEEGGKGAKPMVDAGVVDGVDYFLACHLGMGAPSGSVYPIVSGFLASTKLDVTFRGAAAHAGGAPEEGRNALLGAAQAVQALYAISRHSGGPSRINVGTLRAGSGRNVIADHAFMQMEVRGANDEVEAYMLKRARAVIEGAAMAQDLACEIVFAGRALTAVCDDRLGEVVADAARLVPGLRVSEESLPIGGSEDATFMIRRVQEQGGLATYVGVGSDIPDGHHTPRFDFREQDLYGGIATLALTMARVGAGGVR